MGNNKFKDALNFLMFSYFGITLDSEYNEILSCSIKKAFADATQLGAYNAKLKEEGEKEKFKTNQTNAEKNLKEKIGELILNIPSDKLKNFKDWHDGVCKDIEKEIGSSSFVYGNAQKWVNMTLKYLYLIDNIFLELCPEKTDFRAIQGISSWLHVPVDSYIIEKVWYEEGEDKGKKESFLPIIKECRDGHRGKYASKKVTPWSQWDKPPYETFQNGLRDMIGENINPIDWEGPAWIEIAKKRKGKT